MNPDWAFYMWVLSMRIQSGLRQFGFNGIQTSLGVDIHVA